MAEFETVITGGTIIDGLRTPRFTADIGIKGGRVAYIGRLQPHEGDEVIDASGLIVAPGFVDVHTHYDGQIFWDPYCTMSGWHGITSVVVGNCGFSFAPVRPEMRDRAMLMLSRTEAIELEALQAGMPWDWVTFPEYLDSLDRQAKGVKRHELLRRFAAHDVGHGTGGWERANGDGRRDRADVRSSRRGTGGGSLRVVCTVGRE